MKHPSTSQAPPVGGSIRADEVLPLAEFCRRLRIGRKTWYSMKAAGLRSCEIGKQRYIIGRDVLDFFAKLTEQQAGKGANDG
jgi:hypothetical protein